MPRSVRSPTFDMSPSATEPHDARGLRGNMPSTGGTTAATWSFVTCRGEIGGSAAPPRRSWLSATAPGSSALADCGKSSVAALIVCCTSAQASAATWPPSPASSPEVAGADCAGPAGHRGRAGGGGGRAGRHPKTAGVGQREGGAEMGGAVRRMVASFRRGPATFAGRLSRPGNEFVKSPSKFTGGAWRGGIRKVY